MLDQCLYQTKHHRFADTDPKHIEGLFTQCVHFAELCVSSCRQTGASSEQPLPVHNEYRLGDRMASYAQYVKERALTSLVRALLDTDLESDTLEVNHRILSLLNYCSNSPLNAAYQPGFVLQLLQDPGQTAHWYPHKGMEFNNSGNGSTMMDCKQSLYSLSQHAACCC